MRILSLLSARTRLGVREDPQTVHVLRRHVVRVAPDGLRRQVVLRGAGAQGPGGRGADRDAAEDRNDADVIVMNWWWKRHRRAGGGHRASVRGPCAREVQGRKVAFRVVMLEHTSQAFGVRMSVLPFGAGTAGASAPRAAHTAVWPMFEAIC